MVALAVAPVTAAAQIVPAPKWCVEILNAKPSPTPIIDLYDRVRAAITPKGEFETTASFDQRVEVALSKVGAELVGLYGSSRIVVTVPIYAPYDADKEFFDVGRFLNWPITGFNELRTKSFTRIEHEVVAVEKRLRAWKEYEGQNSFGATTTVLSESREEYGVALTNLRLSKATSWLRGHFILRMSPDAAAAINGKLSVLIVGQLTAPGIIEGVWRSRPTVQRPIDETIDQHYVAMTGSCGGIIATSSRELLHRLN